MHRVYDKQFHYDHLIDQFYKIETRFDSLLFFYNNREKIVSLFNYDVVIIVELSHLFDQIAYQIQECSSYYDKYIIDILYRKAESYLAFMEGLDYYNKFLLIHNLIYDDIVMIWRHSLSNFRERCINDFHQQKSLQYTITTALLSMHDETLIPFFYDIALLPDVDSAISAIVGLSLYRNKFANWEKLYTGEKDYDAMVAIVSSTNINKCNLCAYNQNKYMLFLYCRWAEMFNTKTGDILGLMNIALHTIPENHILFTRTVEIIEHILFTLKSHEFNHFNDNDIDELIMIFNSLPPEKVDGIIRFWNIPKSNFINTLQQTINKKQIRLDNCSNIATLLCTTEFE